MNRIRRVFGRYLAAIAAVALVLVLPLGAWALSVGDLQTGISPQTGGGAIPSVLGVTTASHPYPTGTLVNDNGTVYFINGSTKIPFTNWQAFVGLGYSPKNIVKGDTSNYNRAQSYFITTANAEHPWGTLLSYNGTVYYSHESGLIGIPSIAVLNSTGLTLKNVVKANKYDIALINSSKNLPVLALDDSRMYVPYDNTSNLAFNFSTPPASNTNTVSDTSFPVFDAAFSAQGANISYTLGNVGIGTASPGYKLDVSGTVNASSFCINGSNCISSWPSGGTTVTNTGSGVWSQSGSNVYYNSGNVGVGATNPTSPLHIKGTGAYLVPVVQVDGGGVIVTGATTPTIGLYSTDAGAKKWEWYANISGLTNLSAGTGNFALYNRTDNTAPFSVLNGTVDGVFNINGANVGIGTRNPVGSAGLKSWEVQGGQWNPGVVVDVSNPSWSANNDVQIRVGDLVLNSRNAGSADVQATGERGGNGNLVLGAKGGIYFLTQDKTPATDYKMVISNSGNVGIGLYAPTHLMHLSGGAYSDGAAWTNASDKNLKTNFTALNPQDVLSKISNLSVTQWNYKTDDSSVKHIGPTAQDFYAAFGLNGAAGQTSITTIDPAGVALLGVKALDEKKLDKQSSGIELKDTATGQIYCVQVTNGELVKSKGSCAK